jgi:hypothetical protein
VHGIQPIRDKQNLPLLLSVFPDYFNLEFLGTIILGIMRRFVAFWIIQSFKTLIKPRNNPLQLTEKMEQRVQLTPKEHRQ